MDMLNPRLSHTSHSRRHRRIRPYLFRSVHPTPAAPPSPSFLHRVLEGLRSLPDRPPPSPPTSEHRTPLVRLIDAQKAPTVELPVVSEGVSRS